MKSRINFILFYFLCRFLDSMKIPSSQRSSGFHICDILELNNEKKASSDKDKDDKIKEEVKSADKKKSNDKCQSEGTNLFGTTASSIFTDSFHHYPHMFQASRPWLYSNNLNGNYLF